MPIEAPQKIIDYLQKQNYKKAIKVSEKYLRREPNNVQYDFFKKICLILISPYRMNEYLPCLFDILNTTRLSKNMLTAVILCFHIIERVDILIEILEKSHNNDDPNEDLLIHLFMAYARDESFKNQIRVARILYSRFKKCHSYCWISLCSYFDKKYTLSNSSTLIKDSVEVKVAVKMLQKRLAESISIETEVIILYCYLLKELGLYKDLLDLLNGPFKEKAINIPSEYFSTKIECIMKIGGHEEAIDECIIRFKIDPTSAVSIKTILHIYEHALKDPRNSVNLIKKINEFELFLKDQLKNQPTSSHFQYVYIQLLFHNYKFNPNTNDSLLLKNEIIKLVTNYYNNHVNGFMIYYDLKPFLDTFSTELSHSLRSVSETETENRNISINTILSLWQNVDGFYDSLSIMERIGIIEDKFKSILNTTSSSKFDIKYQTFIIIDIMLSIIQDDNKLYNSWDILFLASCIIQTVLNKIGSSSWILLLCHYIFVNNGYLGENILKMKESLGSRNLLLETIFTNIPFSFTTGGYKKAFELVEKFNYFHYESFKQLSEKNLNALRVGEWRAVGEIIQTKFKFSQSYNLIYSNLSLNFHEFHISNLNLKELRLKQKFNIYRNDIDTISTIVPVNNIPQFYIQKNTYEFERVSFIVDNIDLNIFNKLQSKNRLFSDEIYKKYSEHKLFIIKFKHFLISKTINLLSFSGGKQDLPNMAMATLDELELFSNIIQTFDCFEKKENLFHLIFIPPEVRIWKQSDFTNHIIEFYFKLNEELKAASDLSTIKCAKFKDSSINYVQYINTCSFDQQELIRNTYHIIQMGSSLLESFSYIQTHISLWEDCFKNSVEDKHICLFLNDYLNKLKSCVKDVVESLDLCYVSLSNSTPVLKDDHPFISIKSLIHEDLIKNVWEKNRNEHLSLLVELKNNFEAKMEYRS